MTVSLTLANTNCGSVEMLLSYLMCERPLDVASVFLFSSTKKKWGKKMTECDIEIFTPLESLWEAPDTQILLIMAVPLISVPRLSCTASVAAAWSFTLIKLIEKRWNQCVTNSVFQPFFSQCIFLQRNKSHSIPPIQNIMKWHFLPSNDVIVSECTNTQCETWADLDAHIKGGKSVPISLKSKWKLFDSFGTN